MRALAIDDVKPGMVLARPVRDRNGRLLQEVGTELTATLIAELTMLDVQELRVRSASEEDIPPVPPYMDRFGPDFATTLQARFEGAMVNRTMQELFLRALAHASECYRNYRMHDSRGPETER